MLPDSSHPHALAHATSVSMPRHELLPAGLPREIPRPGTPMLRAFDVVGGVAFALFIGIIMMQVGSMLLRSGDGQATWVGVIAWQSVWLVAAIVCSRLLTSGIQHDTSWRSTREGLVLEWPELLYTAWVIGVVTQMLGGFPLTMGPLVLALAVGISEEFIFRVLLLGWLVTRLTTPVALAVSAVVFGAAHMDSLSIEQLLGVVPQTAGGFVLGAVYLRTRNIIAPIIAHAVWDVPYFVLQHATLAAGGGGAQQMQPSDAQQILGLVPWLAFIIYGLWLVRGEMPLVGRSTPVACACGSCDTCTRWRTSASRP